jgi:hypothetical protein
MCSPEKVLDASLILHNSSPTRITVSSAQAIKYFMHQFDDKMRCLYFSRMHLSHVAVSLAYSVEHLERDQKPHPSDNRVENGASL